MTATLPDMVRGIQESMLFGVVGNPAILEAIAGELFNVTRNPGETDRELVERAAGWKLFEISEEE